MIPGRGVRETFSRDDRLRKRREFEECYASGVRASGRHLQVFVLPADGAKRLGLSVPRRVGNSPTRNRIRRRLREIFRRHRDRISRPVTLVVNARPSAARASFPELREDYEKTVARALSNLKP
ncbi:MAG TPA: ribonuclease P protein component [Thermoanaerobaculia bacterium]